VTVPNGFVFIDKPAGLTSHDVVARVRRALRIKRVGHAGTLDPAATGVLILGVGRATRLMSLASGADKTYTATIRLGQNTVTDDAEGEILATADTSAVTVELIDSAMTTLTGHIEQVPSAVSAVKVDGQRAHARVRAGHTVTLAARPVTVYTFTRTDLRSHHGCMDVDVTVRCGSGTYVRALARDLGEKLGVGGHVTALRRTESAGVSLDECVGLDDFCDEPHVHSALSVVSRWVPVLTVADLDDAALRHGREIKLDPHLPTEGLVAVQGTGGQMVALAQCQDGVCKPTVVMQDPIRASD
jgi:tRNA pseudouridine55 synthase